jgi:mxaL protein
MNRQWLRGRGWSFWALSLTILLVGSCLFRPSMTMERPVYRYLLVIDITQSMNARDYHQDDMPADRLGYTKAAIRATLHELPCGSEVGLGLFTTQNTRILFDPLEICEHFSVVDDVLEHLDWRMAWSANSFVAGGLFSALSQISQRGGDTRLAFFTDGDQVPAEADQPNFNGKTGELQGLIFGVGGLAPVPIPRLDMENRLQGYWEQGDLDTGLSSNTDRSALLMSKVDELRLTQLATLTGLRYQHLTDAKTLIKAMTAPELALFRLVDTDIRQPIALTALLLWLASLLASRLLNWRMGK